MITKILIAGALIAITVPSCRRARCADQSFMDRDPRRQLADRWLLVRVTWG